MFGAERTSQIVRSSSFERGDPISSHRRVHLTWLLFASVLTACQAGTPEALEKEASACPDEQPIAFASRDYFVALNAYYLQEEGARAIRSGLSVSSNMEEVFNKANA